MWVDIFLCLFAILFVWKKTNCRTYPSTQLVLLAGYFFYFYIGVILDYYEPRATSPKYYADLIWFTRSGFLVIFLCSIITKDWKTLRIDYYQSLYSRPNDSADKWLNKHLYPLSGVAVLITLLYLLVIPVQPIIVMLNDASGLGVARESVTTGFKNYGFFSNFFNEYIPLIWLLLFLSRKPTAGMLVLMVNLIGLLSTGQKSPILYILILYVFSSGFIHGKFEYGKCILYTFIAFCALTLLVYTQNAHLFNGLDWESISMSVDGLVRRIFFIGPETVLGYLTTFPDAYPFMIESNANVSADRLVYQNIIGLDIDGTMNSNSLVFFYAWFGDRYLALLLYFLVVMLFFATPAFISLIAPPKMLQIAAFLLFNLLLVKFNLTDWYTIHIVFVLACLVVNGLFILTKFFLNIPNKVISYRTTLVSVILSVLMFLYFTQGQIRSFLN